MNKLGNYTDGQLANSSWHAWHYGNTQTLSAAEREVRSTPLVPPGEQYGIMFIYLLSLASAEGLIFCCRTFYKTRGLASWQLAEWTNPRHTYSSLAEVGCRVLVENGTLTFCPLLS